MAHALPTLAVASLLLAPLAGCASRAPVPLTITCVSRVEPAATPPCTCMHAVGDAGPPAPPPPPPPANPPGPVARWGQSWMPVHVMDTVCPGFVRVRFIPDTEGDEVVPVRDVQERDPQGHLPELHSALPGEPVTAATRLRNGQRILALSGGRWWPGRVGRVLPDDEVRVRYDGYGSESDENLARAAVRLAGTEELSHPAGEAEPHGEPVPLEGVLAAGTPIEARSRGRYYQARVLGTECGPLVRVHFVGWEPAWDAVIERARLRRAPPSR